MRILPVCSKINSKKTQNSQPNFGVKVKFVPKTEELLRNKGKETYYTYFNNAHNLMYWQKDNSVMVVSHKRLPHKKTTIVANLYVQDGDKSLISAMPAERPILTKSKDGHEYIADLYDMYNELKGNLIELKELRYSYKLFEKPKKSKR